MEAYLELVAWLVKGTTTLVAPLEKEKKKTGSFTHKQPAIPSLSCMAP